MVSYYIVTFLSYVLFPASIFLSLRIDKFSDDIQVYKSNIIKGICISVIVLHHVSQSFSSPGLLRPFLDFGYLGVSVFLFLSGYGLTSSFVRKKSLADFAKARLMKVYLPFFILSNIYILTCVLIGNDLRVDFFSFLLFSFGFYIINESYWFVYFIFLSYFIFYVSFRFLKAEIKVISFMILIFIIYWIFCFLLGIGKWWYTTCFCFPLGVFFVLKKEKIHFLLMTYLPFCIFLSLFIMLLSITFAMNSSSFLASVGKTISSLSFVLIFYILVSLVTFKSKLLYLLGNYSYEIYLTHVLILAFISNLQNSIHLFLFFLLVFSGSLVLRYVSKR